VVSRWGSPGGMKQPFFFFFFVGRGFVTRRGRVWEGGFGVEGPRWGGVGLGVASVGRVRGGRFCVGAFCGVRRVLRLVSRKQQP